MEESLCDRCRNIFSTKWRSFSVFGRHEPRISQGWHQRLGRVWRRSPSLIYRGLISDLRPAECRMCEIIFGHVTDATNAGEDDRYAVSGVPGQVPVKDKAHHADRLWNALMSLRHYTGTEFRLMFEFKASTEEVLSVDNRTGISPIISFKLFAEPDSPAASFISRRPNLWDTSADATLAYIRRWISTCDDEHTCRTVSTTSRAPKRVLVIHDPLLGDDIKLTETAQISGFPRYAALSYCWGDPNEHFQLKTLKANFMDHQHLIKTSDLPKTIRDAVTLCRKLDIPYLWVDALCIIQDSDTDKVSEIEAMGHIYANCYLTIAVASARGSNDGFLQPRTNSCFSAPFPKPGGGLMNVKWNLEGRGFLNSTSIVTGMNGGTEHENIGSLEVWHSRGWTFQEIMLSRRTILFSVFQPYWVCQSLSEAGGDPSSGEYLSATGLQNIVPSVAPDVPGKARKVVGFTGNVEYKWPLIAENYSARVLSVLDDKPLAVHAIREKNLQGSSVYMAGTWSNHLDVDLLWSTVRRHPRSSEDVQRFSTSYAEGRITNLPSWSWLSFDGAVRFDIVWHAIYTGKIKHLGEIISHIEVINTPIVDVFGRLQSGCLRVRGCVKPVLIVPTKGRGWGKWPQTMSCYDVKIWDNSTTSYYDRDPEDTAPLHRIGEAVFDRFQEAPPSGIRKSFEREIWDISEDYGKTPRILDCLLVATVGTRQGERSLATNSTTHHLTTQGDQVAYGLLLEDVPGSNGTEKERIGLLRGNEGRCFYFDDAVEQVFNFL